MPISRYQIRDVYSLADPELFKAADKDDPEALLEGVAMAGLVGVLRQLGDLAEFAAEIFHDLHEEVMSTAARGHGLLVRIQQLESEIPLIEGAFFSQTSHSSFFPNSGIDWHPNRQETQNLITTRDLPRFVMDSYEECRGPPRLFLLDKFDIGGAGACLKRYTDPSIFKVEASSDETEIAETQREKKIRQTKKKRSSGKGGETSEGSQSSHVKLHQLFLEERVQTGATEPARRVKLKIRPKKLPFDSESGELYMNKLFISQSHAHEDSHIPSNGPRCEDISQPTDADLVVNDNQIAADDEIRTDRLQNGYPSEDVASETKNYMDALGTMESEVETGITANMHQLPSQLSDSQSIEKSTESNVGNNSISKGITVFGNSDTTSTSTESPPQPFPCIEIPFHPRVVPPVVADNINVTQNLGHDVTSVHHVSSSEEVTSDSNEMCLNHTEKLVSPRKSEEHQMDKQDGKCTSEHTDVLPIVDGLSSFSLVRNINGDLSDKDSNDRSIPMILLPDILETARNQGKYDEKIRSSDSLVNSSQSVISRLSELSSDNTSNDHIPVTEDIHDSLVCSSQSVILQLSGDTAFNDHIPVAEDIHEEQLKEKVAAVLVVSDQTEARVSYSGGRETESDNAEIEPVTVSDANTNECIDYSVLKEGTGTKSEETEIESTYSYVNRDDDKVLEDDTKLELMEADSVYSDTGARAATSVDVDKNEDNNHSVSEQDSKEFGEKEEVDELLVISSDDMDNNDDNPSLNSKILQDQNHSFLAETDRKKESDTESVNDLEIKSPSHIYILEAAQSSPLEDKVDQSNNQLHMQLDHETHIDTPLQDLQSSSESFPVLVSEKSPAMESNSHDINVSDQVKLPQLAPVKREDLPPLPPLPPMQWRMKILQNASSASTNGGQYTEDQDSEPDSQMLLPDSKHNEAKSAETLVPHVAVETHPMMPTIYHQEVFWPSSIPYPPPVFDEMPSNIQPMKVQRPRSPLIDAVAAHDRIKLRKVSDRDTTQIPKGEERETLLDQIRAKSINLKPAVQTRPIIQGPNTNLRVAAILEKANAIRQAFAGSDDDDDDDSDNWSDS